METVTVSFHCDECGRDIEQKVHAYPAETYTREGWEVPEQPVPTTTGYGIEKNPDGTERKICYKCCAAADLAYMHKNGRIALYLVKIQRDFTDPADVRRFMSEPGAHVVTNNPLLMRVTRHEVQNWPGSLHLTCGMPRRGYHNIARYRYDVWFAVPGERFYWHGVQYGDNTMIVHCKRTKDPLPEYMYRPDLHNETESEEVQ